MEYSDTVLETTPERVTKFLMGIGAVAAIRTLMAGAGMTDDDILEGRALLLDVLAAPRQPGASADTDDARAQRAATGELDQWDEPNFARHGAALRRRFPEVNTYVFKDLAPSTGTAAVQGVATFLARLDALENGTDPGRTGLKQSDKKAVAFLGTRGLDKAERKRLQGLVDVALGPTSPLPEQTELPESARRREALAKLRAWFDEWSTTARAVIKKRSYLIRLGLASRKVRQRKPTAAPPNPGKPTATPPNPAERGEVTGDAQIK
ncbi:hypothetical protein WME90_39545 [Sorangium sp. So ce375]|uniref:hypothetical protein n=1 Tax=Sorangium sp. So ce375 TaxID=3133306 RepID=UPI003F5C4AAC